jgi:hypothetical protein
VRGRASVAALAVLGGLGACRSEAPPSAGPPPERTADLVLEGGVILTLDERAPRVDAIAIKDGRILALGADVAGTIGPDTRRLTLDGGSCTPGLQDAHAHLPSLGRQLEEVDLRGASSIEEVVARLKQQAPATGWIVGRGWDQNLWPGQAMPTHGPLTEAFPDRPVWLRRVDGHAGWGNEAVLKAAGVDATTPDPEGGELLRDEQGLPTGVFVDTAMGAVPVPRPDDDEIRRSILAGQAHALERGLTGVHDMGVSESVDRIYRELAAGEGEERLRIRVTGYADVDWFEDGLAARTPDVPAPEDPYALVGVKAYADGALGSRGAALLAPYADRPDHRGKLIRSEAELERLAVDAMGRGWQLATHAIGDRGNRAVLDAYAAAFQRHRRRDHRFRVEHAQILDLADIPRFAELGVIASMQPTHATSDMAWVPARIGPDRVAGAYAWQRFLGTGAHVAFGSDFPVELADVTHGLYAAVTRQDPDGQPPGGWLPEQRVSLAQALRGFTVEAAYAGWREEHLGALRPGAQADVSCFVEDLEAATPATLRAATVRATIVRGRVEWERD